MISTVKIYTHNYSGYVRFNINSLQELIRRITGGFIAMQFDFAITQINNLMLECHRIKNDLTISFYNLNTQRIFAEKNINLQDY